MVTFSSFFWQYGKNMELLMYCSYTGGLSVVLVPRRLCTTLCKDSGSVKERGVAVGGCRSSVAVRWRLKPEVLSSIPSGATFLSFLLSFQKSTDSNGTRLSFSRRSLSVFGLWGSPIHRTPHAVIMLTIQYDQQLHAAIIQYIPHIYVSVTKMAALRVP